MLIWLDLETTGLDPRAGSILEIAMIATDDNFEQIGVPFVSIVRPIHLRGWEVMDDYVREMHTKSALAYEIWCDPDRRAVWDNVPRLGDVERAAIQWLAGINVQHAALASIPYDKFISDVTIAFRGTPLAGNTVHFDKRFLLEHMNELEALFSHRIYDVSSFTEEVKRSAPEVYARRPGLGPDGKPVLQHRALDDIKNSIETAKFYRSCARWSVNA